MPNAAMPAAIFIATRRFWSFKAFIARLSKWKDFSVKPLPYRQRVCKVKLMLTGLLCAAVLRRTERMQKYFYPAASKCPNGVL